MRIACPSCAAEYEVPTSRMTPRRMVRCERCGNEWVAVQEIEASPAVNEPDEVGPPEHADPEEDVASPPTARINVAPMDRLTPSRPSSRRDVRLLAAWIASVVLLAGAATAVVICRSDVVRAWPAGARLLGSPAVVAMPAHAPPAHAPGGTAAKTAEKPVTHE